MLLPKSVKIFGRKFKIVEKALGGYLGLCDRETSTLFIEVAQSEREKCHTLIHEIGHAVIGRVGINQAIPLELEEVIVDAVATALVENFDIYIKGSVPPPVKSKG